MLASSCTNACVRAPRRGSPGSWRSRPRCGLLRARRSWRAPAPEDDGGGDERHDDAERASPSSEFRKNKAIPTPTNVHMLTTAEIGRLDQRLERVDVCRHPGHDSPGHLALVVVQRKASAARPDPDTERQQIRSAVRPVTNVSATESTRSASATARYRAEATNSADRSRPPTPLSIPTARGKGPPARRACRRGRAAALGECSRKRLRRWKSENVWRRPPFLFEVDLRDVPDGPECRHFCQELGRGARPTPSARPWPPVPARPGPSAGAGRRRGWVRTAGRCAVGAAGGVGRPAGDVTLAAGTSVCPRPSWRIEGGRAVHGRGRDVGFCSSPDDIKRYSAQRSSSSSWRPGRRRGRRRRRRCGRRGGGSSGDGR